MEKLKSKKSFKVILLLFSLIFFIFQFGSVLADNVNNDNFILEADKTYDGTAFFSGDNINIKGRVDGTTFIAGNNIDVSGVIDGDLFVAGNNITVSGDVSGSLITASQDILVSGNIENNIYSAGANLTLKSKTKGAAFLAGSKIIIEEKSMIEKDLFASGFQIFQKGEVLGSFFGSSDNTSISGLVGKNVKLATNDLYLESAEINGDLKYDSTNEATISNDSKILGRTEWNEIEPELQKTAFSVTILMNVLFSILGLLVTWFIVKLLRPDFWTSLARNIRVSPLKTLGLGTLALIVTPTAIFFLLISIVLYPLAFLFTAIYAIAIYISRIIVAVFIGEWIQTKFGWKYRHKGVWTTLLGLVIISILGMIPIMGLLVKLLVIIIGLGSIVLYVSNRKLTN